jgi:hypothetical protein
MLRDDKHQHFPMESFWVRIVSFFYYNYIDIFHHKKTISVERYLPVIIKKKKSMEDLSVEKTSYV